MPYDIPSYSTRAPETAEQLLREATDRALAEQNGVQRQPRQRAVRPPGGAERLIQEMVEPAPPRDPDAVERVQTALTWWQDSQRKLSEQRSQRAAIQGEGSERLPSRTMVDVPTMRGPQAGMWVGGDAPEEFPRDRIEGFTATTGTTPPTAPGSIYRPGAHGMDVNIPPRSFDPPTPTHGKSPNEVVELLRKYGGGTGQPSRQAIPPGSPGERQQAHMLDIVDAARSTSDLGQALMTSGARQPSQRELGLRTQHRARLAKTRATRQAGVRRKGAARSWHRVGANPMQAMALSGGMGGGGGMDNPLMMAMMGAPPSVTTAMIQSEQQGRALTEHGRQFDVTGQREERAGVAQRRHQRDLAGLEAGTRRDVAETGTKPQLQALDYQTSETAHARGLETAAMGGEDPVGGIRDIRDLLGERGTGRTMAVRNLDRNIENKTVEDVLNAAPSDLQGPALRRFLDERVGSGAVDRYLSDMQSIVKPFSQYRRYALEKRLGKGHWEAATETALGSWQSIPPFNLLDWPLGF